jgi:two-component system response regulator AtoC
MAHALVVDSDRDRQRSVADLARRQGLTVSLADSLRKARIEMGRHCPDVLFLDPSLPDGDGLALLADLERGEETKVVLMSEQPSVELALMALRAHVTDLIGWPRDSARVQHILSALAGEGETHPPGESAPSPADRVGIGGLLGESPAIKAVHAQLARVAPTSATVLLVGETGTGKELAAQTIHRLSRRSRQPFFPLNCGAVSAQLIESELFGHERGSFTGADRQHKGFFERADGGTIFLDEVTEMPLELQVKLLRVLETGSFTRVGSVQPIQSNVRLLSATNRIPQQAVRLGKLREDLLHRLNAFPIQLPSLRERREDIELLAQHFLRELNRVEGTSKVFAPEALTRWRLAPWPGNVRELRNAVQRSFILADDELQAETPAMRDYAAPDKPSSGTWAASESGAVSVEDRRNVSIRIGTNLLAAQQQIAVATLVNCSWGQDQAARLLGITTADLVHLLGPLGPKQGREGTGPSHPIETSESAPAAAS